MNDSMLSVRKLRMLNVIDECARESPAIETDTALSGKRVTSVLNRITTESVTKN